MPPSASLTTCGPPARSPTRPEPRTRSSVQGAVRLPSPPSRRRDDGCDREAADFLFSRFIWAASSVRTERGPLARWLLGQGKASPDPVVLAYGRQAWGIYQWDIGNIGEAMRYMGDNWAVFGEPSRRV